MNIYSRKQVWKLLLLIIAVIIGISSLWVTNNLVNKLELEERKKIELWAKGMKALANTENPNQDITFIFEVIKNNETVPVIIADENDSIVVFRNLDSLKTNDPSYLKSRLTEMKKHCEPIEMIRSEKLTRIVYYEDSTILIQLLYYPYIQLAVIFLFILVAYFAFSSSRKAEQNQVWVGMAKETAHQLGTPISSLMAWIELLSLKNVDQEILLEIGKDIKRLEIVTERFSKIGSGTSLVPVNVIEVLNNVVSYMRTRTSSKVQFILKFPVTGELIVPLNPPLFEWVIENICKNAIDSMESSGTIEISLFDQMQVLFIDIKDTGRGIPKSKQKTVFQPGYTTKKRGWGLGLSLSKRIIEVYHNGKIFVKSSEVNVGTTFRIALKK
ncbi:MAG: HAMP domain-containing histidine kinase [Bacteroidia bacterium]|nr:HAMP domain-containing histidine kinase [Bacteroidia bacterium]